MQRDGATGGDGTVVTVGVVGKEYCGNLAGAELDQGKQQQQQALVLSQEEAGGGVSPGDSTLNPNPTLLAIVISNPELVSTKEDLPGVASPRKGYLSRSASSHEQCRVCQQDKEEVLIDLGCKCKGGLAKAHRSCIDTWFSTRGSNKCEICQDTAANVSPPESQPTVGVIVVLGLGTAIRLALEFCHEWNLRRVVQRADGNVNLGYPPAL
ncbi:hypothetical protein Tsubulata_004468 [Turnera subulata]|uniref:RING-CH-type domain-containing protein n=1 Tax=Turnera subulata TaxID=218843 RepID=A0A9Q0JQC4_9ROSI|nr:hypothetical protein Tsubulata_004468 [Turnera subulata]